MDQVNTYPTFQSRYGMGNATNNGDPSLATAQSDNLNPTVDNQAPQPKVDLPLTNPWAQLNPAAAPQQPAAQQDTPEYVYKGK